jgi:hypothetical protein
MSSEYRHSPAAAEHPDFDELSEEELGELIESELRGVNES